MNSVLAMMEPISVKSYPIRTGVVEQANASTDQHFHSKFLSSTNGRGLLTSYYGTLVCLQCPKLVDEGGRRHCDCAILASRLYLLDIKAMLVVFFA